jgi:predicted membrane-bound mannosyltransferase
MTKAKWPMPWLTVSILLPFAVVAQVTAIKDIQETSDASGDSPMNGEIVTISGIVTGRILGKLQ